MVIVIFLGFSLSDELEMILAFATAVDGMLFKTPMLFLDEKASAAPSQQIAEILVRRVVSAIVLVLVWIDYALLCFPCFNRSNK